MKTAKVLNTTARTLVIIYILFLSMFALDTFSEGLSFWEMILGFIMHMLPSIVVIIFLIVAWKMRLLGGILLLALGLFFGWFFARNDLWGWTVASPIVISGILFILSHVLLKKHSTSLDLNKKE